MSDLNIYTIRGIGPDPDCAYHYKSIDELIEAIRFEIEETGDAIGIPWDVQWTVASKYMTPEEFALLSSVED